MAVNVTLLEQISSDLLCQLLHDSVDDLVGKFSHPHGNNNKDRDWSEESYAEARKLVQNLYRNMACNPDYAVEEDYDHLNSQKIDTIKECFAVRKSEIYSALYREALSKLEHGVMTDFDWKLKLIVGSSALSSIKEPLLQLKLSSAVNDKVSDVNVEMNLSELDSFINAIETGLNELEKK